MRYGILPPGQLFAGSPSSYAPAFCQLIGLAVVGKWWMPDREVAEFLEVFLSSLPNTTVKAFASNDSFTSTLAVGVFACSCATTLTEVANIMANATIAFNPILVNLFILFLFY